MERVKSSHDGITVAYWDCPTGIAGDMCLGALVDLGVPLEYLSERLKSLGIGSEYELRSEKVHRRGQMATKVHVDLTREEKPEHHHPSHHTPARSQETGAGSQESGVRSQESGGDHHHPSHHTPARHQESGIRSQESGGERDRHSHHTPARHLPTIRSLIQKADLPPRAREWSLQIFDRLAIAEGAVHGIAPEKVHFHEVGATDAIVDIVGTCLGLDWLGVEEFYCSPLPTGSGTVKAAHGRLPVPVPAVVKLWESRQVPIYSNGIEGELVTPTGAAIATTLALDFGAPPAMRLEKIGLGAGTKDFPIPNILRLWLGKKEAVNRENIETIAILETQIDDLEPRAIAYLLENLLAAGALDVFTQAITLKKSRSGILVTVLCPVELLVTCETLIFRETTTLGIRRRIQERSILQREIQTVETPHGAVRVKIGYRDSSERPLTVQPEYEDCASIARKTDLPWREVHRMALDAWRAGNR